MEMFREVSRSKITPEWTYVSLHRNGSKTKKRKRTFPCVSQRAVDNKMDAGLSAGLRRLLRRVVDAAPILHRRAISRSLTRSATLAFITDVGTVGRDKSLLIYLISYILKNKNKHCI